MLDDRIQSFAQAAHAGHFLRDADLSGGDDQTKVLSALWLSRCALVVTALGDSNQVVWAPPAVFKATVNSGSFLPVCAGTLLQIPAESPFDTLDRKEIGSGNADRLLEHVRTGLLAPYRERLAERLRALFIAAEEDDISPSAPSLQNLVRFMQTHRTIRYPDVVLMPDGNFRAEWRRSARQMLALEFLGNGEVRFLVFAPDRKDPIKTIRAAGSAPMDSVMDIVSGFGVSSWA